MNIVSHLEVGRDLLKGLGFGEWGARGRRVSGRCEELSDQVAAVGEDGVSIESRGVEPRGSHKICELPAIAVEFEDGRGESGDVVERRKAAAAVRSNEFARVGALVADDGRSALESFNEATGAFGGDVGKEHDMGVAQGFEDSAAIVDVASQTQMITEVEGANERFHGGTKRTIAEPFRDDGDAGVTQSRNHLNPLQRRLVGGDAPGVTDAEFRGSREGGNFFGEAAFIESLPGLDVDVMNELRVASGMLVRLKAVGTMSTGVCGSPDATLVPAFHQRGEDSVAQPVMERFEPVIEHNDAVFDTVDMNRVRTAEPMRDFRRDAGPVAEKRTHRKLQIPRLLNAFPQHDGCRTVVASEGPRRKGPGELDALNPVQKVRDMSPPIGASPFHIRRNQGGGNDQRGKILAPPLDARPGLGLDQQAIVRIVNPEKGDGQYEQMFRRSNRHCQTPCSTKRRAENSRPLKLPRFVKNGWVEAYGILKFCWEVNETYEGEKKGIGGFSGSSAGRRLPKPGKADRAALRRGSPGAIAQPPRKGASDPRSLR